MNVTLHIVDLWQHLRCNPMRSLNGALPLPYVPVRVIQGALVTNRYIRALLLAAEFRSSTRILFLSQYLRGTILLALFSMMCLTVGCQLRAGPMPFSWPSFSLPFCLLLFSFVVLVQWVCIFGLWFSDWLGVNRLRTFT